MAAASDGAAMTLVPIIPTIRRDPFDGSEWTFELKFDGFRGIADTVSGRMLSKRGNRMKRFEGLLATLPAGCIFDGTVSSTD
jgi:ATP-dependent DNA ligase